MASAEELLDSSQEQSRPAGSDWSAPPIVKTPGPCGTVTRCGRWPSVHAAGSAAHRYRSTADTQARSSMLEVAGGTA